MNATNAPPIVLLLPGWLNSGEGHWQTHWERLHGHRRVEQADWQWPRRGDWMAQLEEAVLTTAAAAPQAGIALAAHSLGCHLVAAWAAHTRHAPLVHAALLVAPPDLADPFLPPQLHGWRREPEVRLPFPSLLLSSSDDPYCGEPHARALAARWGCAYRCLGQRGHLNADSGLGDWPDGLAELHALAGRPG